MDGRPDTASQETCPDQTVFIVRDVEGQWPRGRRVDAKSRRAGVRGLIVATKPGHSGGAKGTRKREGEMTTHSERTPATVPLAQQAGDARSRWSWVEPCVWTDRMLATLEPARPEGGRGTFRRSIPSQRTTPCPPTARGGVKGDKWFANVNQTLVGWFGYFQPSRPWIFGRLDSGLRGRLRSLLRRHHQRGVARGPDLPRWPNRFFAEQGLFSLARAHASVVQSSRR